MNSNGPRRSLPASFPQRRETRRPSRLAERGEGRESIQAKPQYTEVPMYLIVSQTEFSSALCTYLNSLCWCCANFYLSKNLRNDHMAEYNNTD